MKLLKWMTVPTYSDETREKLKIEPSTDRSRVQTWRTLQAVAGSTAGVRK